MKRSINIIAVISVAMISLLISGGVKALNYSTDPIELDFVYGSALTIDTGDGEIEIGNVTPGQAEISDGSYAVKVSTNNLSGYTLSASVGCASGTNCYDSTALSDGTNVFNMLTSDGVLTSGTWGISLSSSDTASSSFKTLPKHDGTARIINQTINAGGTGASGYAGTDSTTVRIGVYATTSQMAGTYTNTINFIAVANPAA